MTKNVGSIERVLRLLGALGFIACAWLAPLPLLVRALVFGGSGVYMLWTALAGHCLGYRLMGRSTCRVPTNG